MSAGYHIHFGVWHEEFAFCDIAKAKVFDPDGKEMTGVTGISVEQTIDGTFATIKVLVSKVTSGQLPP